MVKNSALLCARYRAKATLAKQSLTQKANKK